MGSSLVGLICAEGLCVFSANVAAIAGEISVLALDVTEESSPVLGSVATVRAVILRGMVRFYSKDFRGYLSAQTFRQA